MAKTHLVWRQAVNAKRLAKKGKGAAKGGVTVAAASIEEDRESILETMSAEVYATYLRALAEGRRFNVGTFGVLMGVLNTAYEPSLTYDTRALTAYAIVC